MATKKSEKASTEKQNVGDAKMAENVLTNLTETQNSINELKKENEELKKQLQAIINSLNTSQTESKPIIDTNSLDETYEQDYPEPPLNKNIKVISLFHGSLNLSDGMNARLSFSKYGQSKNCLYGKLIDIVNHDMKFAKAGYFYIADKAAVYHLGLTDDYKHIQPKEVLDNICKYDVSIIKDIGNTLTDEQKENLAFGIAHRMYDGEIFDFNKIKVLSESIDISIENLCEEMRQTENIKNSQNKRLQDEK